MTQKRHIGACDFEKRFPQGLLCSMDDVPEGWGFVYVITNLVNDKVYVGQTWLPGNKRWRLHVNETRTKTNLLSARAIRKYGEENFSVGLLGLAEDQPSLDRLENLWIILLNSRNKSFGYNVRGGGSRGKHSEDTKKKMSDSLLLYYSDPINKQKRGEISRSKEIRQKISDSLLKGLEENPERRERLSQTATSLWSTPDFRKKIMDSRSTPEVKEKVLLGRSSPEYIKAASERAKKRWQDPEYRKLQEEAMERRRAPKPTKIKKSISQIMKDYWSDPIFREKRIQEMTKARQKNVIMEAV